MFILTTFTVPNTLLLLPRLFRDLVNYFFNSVWILHLKRIRCLRPLRFVLAFSLIQQHSLSRFLLLDSSIYWLNSPPGKQLLFSPRNNYSPCWGSSPSSPRVLNPAESSWLASLTVFASASGQLVTVTSFLLLCSWTYSGGLIFFLGFLAFL